MAPPIVGQLLKMRLLTSAALFLSLAFQTPAQAAGIAIDAQNSSMTVYVDKKGLFSFLADNHVIDVPIAEGAYDAAAQTVELTIDAAALNVRDPQLSADRRAQVQAAMTGAKVLDAKRYPTITFRSTQIERKGSRLKVLGNLSLHGQTHPIVVSAREIDPMHFTGSATIRQTDFGITPIKVVGGAVSVRDDVKIEFRIALDHKKN